MKAAVGFTAIWNGTASQHQLASEALERSLSHFPGLHQMAIDIGETKLTLWGRENLEECFHVLQDGSVLALIGSPAGKHSWSSITKMVHHEAKSQHFQLPWDGRVILLHVRADGIVWECWNDWLGSIPVFHSHGRENRVASTIESVVIAAKAFTQEDFFLPGVVCLMTHGNFLGDWTLYKNMKVLPPDSHIIWSENGMTSKPCHTVMIDDSSCDAGWGDLIEAMHALTETAIKDALDENPSWILPLSSGLDSRLIAVVGAENGYDIDSFSWGPPTTRDVIFSKRIADAVGIRWRRIDLGQDYLEQYVHMWAELFGSSMHFHGMYQLPALTSIAPDTGRKIASGFLGDALAGYDVEFQAKHHVQNHKTYYALPYDYAHWDVDSLKSLFKIPVDDAIEQMAALITEQREAVEGSWYQRIRFITFWGRQRHFTHFQSMLSDYWTGVATPFLNREYARFCLSLPRSHLDGRRLQIDMMRHFYPKVMAIPGTYTTEPAILTGRYLLSRRIVNILPELLTRKLFPEFSAVKHLKTDILSIRAGKKRAIWPISEKTSELARWIDMNILEKTYTEAIEGDMRAVRRLQSIQAFAYRL